MFTLAIFAGFGARRTAGNGFFSTAAHVFELGNVEAHLNRTPKKPRTDRPSRLMQCDLVTWKRSSINPSSDRWTSVIGRGVQPRSGQKVSYASTISATDRSHSSVASSDSFKNSRSESLSANRLSTILSCRGESAISPASSISFRSMPSPAMAKFKIPAPSSRASFSPKSGIFFGGGGPSYRTINSRRRQAPASPHNRMRSRVFDVTITPKFTGNWNESLLPFFSASNQSPPTNPFRYDAPGVERKSGATSTPT